jgi:hypothetical protein
MQQVIALWSQMIGDETEVATARQAKTVIGQKTAVSPPSPFAFLRHSLVGLAILLVTFFGAILLTANTATTLPNSGQIRLVINHGGALLASSDELSAELLEKLPDNVNAAQLLGGERLPVRLRLDVDGETVLENTYEARGLRQEGSIYGLESWWVNPGEHVVTVWLMDDEIEWRVVFEGNVVVPESGVVRLLYNDEQDVFEQ